MTTPDDDDAQREAPAVRPSPIIDLSRPERQPTQVMDLSRTLRLHTVRLEVSQDMLAELRTAPAEVGSEPAPPSPVMSHSWPESEAWSAQPATVRTLAFERPPQLAQQAGALELANTLYDGGALRDFASQLAGTRENESASASASVNAEEPPRGSLVARTLRRQLAAFRRASWTRQLTIALLPLAIAGVWTMQDASATASVAQPRASARAPAPPRSLPSASPVTAPVASAAASSPSAASSAAAAPPARLDDPNERLALIAAFSGNKAEAAALYEGLARSHNSRAFALAARLVREDHVRKP